MASISRFIGLTLTTRERLTNQTAAFFARGLEGALNTQRAYHSDLHQLRLWLAAIRKWHKLNKHPDPVLDETVQTVLEGIKRTLGTETGQDPAFEIEEFKEKIRQIPATPADRRDRALLLVGFVGAFRRSELVVLDVEGLQFTREGAVIT